MSFSDDIGSNYNSKCITKLLSNFRSHPKLLDLPSKLFYDSGTDTVRFQSYSGNRDMDIRPVISCVR